MSTGLSSTKGFTRGSHTWRIIYLRTQDTKFNKMKTPSLRIHFISFSSDLTNLMTEVSHNCDQKPREHYALLFTTTLPSTPQQQPAPGRAGTHAAPLVLLALLGAQPAAGRWWPIRKLSSRLSHHGRPRELHNGSLAALPLAHFSSLRCLPACI